MSDNYSDKEGELVPKNHPLAEEMSMQDLASLALESLVENYKTDNEPFEIYTQKLKSHLHTDPELFRHRFMQGYEMMIEILRKPEKKDL